MATTNTPLDFSPNSFRRLDPTKYTSLGDFIDEVNKPDNRDLLVKTYGNQGITGFLQMVGAVKSNGAADEVQYWEETRLHQLQTVNFPSGGVSAGTAGTSIVLTMASATATATGATKAAAQKYLRVNDVILVGGVDRIAVGVGEVGEDATPLEASGLHERKELGGLLMPDAGATHTGVDLDVHLSLESRLRDRGGESLRLFERVQREVEAEGQRAREFTRQGRAEQEDISVMADLAQVRGFGDVRHREAIHAGLQ